MPESRLSRTSFSDNVAKLKSAGLQHLERLTVATKATSSVARWLKLSHIDLQLVLGWVTVREDRVLWTCVGLDLICDLTKYVNDRLHSRHLADTDVKWIKKKKTLNRRWLLEKKERCMEWLASRTTSSWIRLGKKNGMICRGDSSRCRLLIHL